VIPVGDVAKMSPVKQMPRCKHYLCEVQFCWFCSDAGICCSWKSYVEVCYTILRHW